MNPAKAPITISATRRRSARKPMRTPASWSTANSVTGAPMRRKSIEEGRTRTSCALKRIITATIAM